MERKKRGREGEKKKEKKRQTRGMKMKLVQSEYEIREKEEAAWERKL